MAPFLRDTLVGLNYVHYAPPGAQVLYTNPLFVRSHDFIGLQGATKPGRPRRSSEPAGHPAPAEIGRLPRQLALRSGGSRTELPHPVQRTGPHLGRLGPAIDPFRHRPALVECHAIATSLGEPAHELHRNATGSGGPQRRSSPVRHRCSGTLCHAGPC